jgi:hypothetical protein
MLLHLAQRVPRDVTKIIMSYLTSADRLLARLAHHPTSDPRIQYTPEMLAWLREFWAMNKECISENCARYNYLILYKCLIARQLCIGNKYPFCIMQIFPDDSIYPSNFWINCAQYGRVDMMRYVEIMDPKWDDTKRQLNNCDDDICDESYDSEYFGAEENNLTLSLIQSRESSSNILTGLKWLRKNGFRLTPACLNYATDLDNMDVFNYIFTECQNCYCGNPATKLYGHCVNHANRGDYTNDMEEDLDHPCDDVTIAYAVLFENDEATKFLIDYMSDHGMAITGHVFDAMMQLHNIRFTKMFLDHMFDNDDDDKRNYMQNGMGEHELDYAASKCEDVVKYVDWLIQNNYVNLRNFRHVCCKTIGMFNLVRNFLENRQIFCRIIECKQYTGVSWYVCGRDVVATAIRYGMQFDAPSVYAGAIYENNQELIALLHDPAVLSETIRREIIREGNFKLLRKAFDLKNMFAVGLMIKSEDVDISELEAISNGTDISEFRQMDCVRQSVKRLKRE